MIQQIKIPIKEAGIKPYEYKHHYLFVKKYAEYAGIKVELIHRTHTVYCTRTTLFSMEVDGQQVLVDYSDHEPLSDYQTGISYLKFHYHPELHGQYENIFPVGPMLDLPDLALYQHFFNLTDQQIYTCNNDLVLNCQRPYQNALRRRKMVQHLLRTHYGDKADTSFKRNGQAHFWEKHRNCLVAVCVPGARNNMLDRGQYEQMALGVCTISPHLRTTLPYFAKPVPGVHYLRCKDDYSDLTALIEWCKQHRNECRRIGQNAHKFFLENSMPIRYWQWIEKCLEVSLSKVN